MKNTAPSCLTHFCTTLYPLSFISCTGLYFPFIIQQYLLQQSMLKAAQIYLLIGFFASGKTTLIRKLLAQNSTKYAIIQNQFAEGEMGIEQPLIMDETGTPFSSFLELPNGCICCSAKNDLVAAVEYIINNTQVRNIVVETNGLADPAASIKQFWFDEQMKINGELHSVITMVSARKWDEIKRDEIFVKQVVYANKIIVSFIDLMGEQKFKDIQTQLKQINCESIIERSDKINLQLLLQQNTLFNKDILLKGKNETIHNHSHGHIKPIFISGHCKLKQKIQVEQKVGELLWESGLKILRIKGIICLEGEQYVYELQGVQDLFDVKPTKTIGSVYNNETRILVVGENLSQEQIKSLFSISN